MLWVSKLSRVAQIPEISEENLIKIKNIANSTTQEHSLVLRANMVLACVNGMQIKQIAMEYISKEVRVDNLLNICFRNSLFNMHFCKLFGEVGYYQICTSSFN